MIYKSTSMKYVAEFQQIYYSQFSTLVLYCTTSYNANTLSTTSYTHNAMNSTVLLPNPSPI